MFVLNIVLKYCSSLHFNITCILITKKAKVSRYAKDRLRSCDFIVRLFTETSNLFILDTELNYSPFMM